MLGAVVTAWPRKTMPGTGSHNFVPQRFTYTGDMGARLAEAHGKIRRQRQKEKEKEVQKFKRALMQYVEREAKKEAKKLKDATKKLKDEKKAQGKTRGLRMLEESLKVEKEDAKRLARFCRALVQCCAGKAAV